MPMGMPTCDNAAVWAETGGTASLEESAAATSRFGAAWAGLARVGSAWDSD
jgi:hypothetical protein